MASTFFGLNIAASGVYTYNAWINTTAHNIANVKTEGYSRQTVNQKTKEAISTGSSYGMMGAGATVVSIDSSRDAYYDYKYRKNNAVFGYYDTTQYYMKSIEDHMYSSDSESGGVSNSLDNFFSALTELTTDATDLTKRTQVAGYADTLSEYVHELSTNLQQMQEDINSQILTTVEQINAYARQIASLTRQINTVEVYGSKANDLRDARAQLIDELSELADVNVVEKEAAEGAGINQYIVTIGGENLVDTYNYRTLVPVASETLDNQCDVEGLYSLNWSDGTSFTIRNTQLGGKLQALFEVRDGNNGENFKAKLTEYTSTTVTVVADADCDENTRNLAKLSIPSHDGCITIGNLDYEYESFEVSVSLGGTYTYTFTLKEELGDAAMTHIENVIGGETPYAEIGDAVEYRGIPYYMSQLNEFLRTFTANFNQLQNIGYDLNGDLGQDLFMAKDITTGDQLNMVEYLKNKSDGYYYYNGYKVFDDSSNLDTYVANVYGETYTLTESETDEDEDGVYYNILDANGKQIEKVYIPNETGSVLKFSSITESGSSTSYYNMTATNISANKYMVKDGSLLACASEHPSDDSGVAESNNLEKMRSLENDNSIFKQGTPNGFLQVMTATIGVDTEKVITSAENAKNIVDAVDNRRLSVTGVDEDEEAQNLIITQNLLNAQYKVISVMNEIIEKLINDTGV